MTDNVISLEHRFLNERQAAEYLGFSPLTLRQSRWNNELAGLPAPQHVYFGRNVRYKFSVLQQWAMVAQKGELNG